jgi:hypothetical protein
MSEASSTKTRLGPTWTVTDFPDVFAKNGGGSNERIGARQDRRLPHDQRRGGMI